MSDVQNIKSVLTFIMVIVLSKDIGCHKNSDLLLLENHLRLVNDVIKGTLIEHPIDEKENADEAFEDSENG